MKIALSGHLRMPAMAAAILLMALGPACKPAEPARPPTPAQASGAQLPRTPEGTPDFSGIWQALTTASWDLEDHSAEEGVPAGPSVVQDGEIPYQPWALAKKK